MINALLGKKIEQTEGFQNDGTRVPVTVVEVAGNPVTFIKNKKKHGYTAVQIGFGIRKHPNPAEAGQARGAKLNYTPRFLREVRFLDTPSDLPAIGDVIHALDVFKPGDIVDVCGVSKGKGFAGVVKRHNFRGGPRTHGQSDRERAPGSIGQTTTPGRVYKGKRMAGRMGQENVTIKNLLVLDVASGKILVKGLIPGSLGSMVRIEKVGEHKKFVSLYTSSKTEEKEPLLKPELEEIKSEQEKKLK